MPMKISPNVPSEAEMWSALKKFAQGGLYEARLENFTGKNHGNHDLLVDENPDYQMPFMLKVLFDNMIPDFLKNDRIFTGKSRIHN